MALDSYEKAPDYVADDSQLPQGAMARWNANIEAIRLAKRLDEQGRRANSQEQKVLGQYSGFGDSEFEHGFREYTHDKSWRERGDELRSLIDPEAYQAIRDSRRNAFYTSPEIIKAMWSGLRDMGADDLATLKVLEPSAGSGRFLSYQPPDLAKKSRRTAVELDKTTGSILDHLYPRSAVWVTGFQEAPVRDNDYDVAISNVPFGSYGVHDPEYMASGRKYLTNRIHNYFFAKTLDKLKPGGVLAFITTRHTMDAGKARGARKYLADHADLVGAVRLPAKTFGDTEVVADILYLRKRIPGEVPGDSSWVDTEEITVDNQYGQPNTYEVNKYFLANPEKVLGKHSAGGTMYRGNEYAVASDPDRPLDAALSQQITRIAKAAPNVLQPVSRRDDTPRFQVVPEDASPKARELAALSAQARKLLALEQGDETDEVVEQNRAALREAYQGFVAQHGKINSPRNRKEAADPLARALESYDRTTEEWEPAALLERRVAGATAERTIASAADAMSVTLNESGTLDFERMGQLLGETPVEVRKSLADDGLVYENPVGGWETADEYLTGRVREKLRVAQQMAQRDPAYASHVAALEAVQPEDIPSSNIATPIGAPWIPAQLLNQWVTERWRAGQDREFFRYSPESARWTANPSVKVDAPDYMMSGQWGTDAMKGDKILLHALAGSQVNITKPDPAGSTDAAGNIRRVRDEKAVQAVQGKIKQMQQDFNQWVWQDPDRRDRLARLYNDTHNDIKPRVFDGSHQTFPGMSPKWQNQMRQHQKDAIFRVVQDGTALLAHEVGFGKTAAMAGSSMERKRLGLTDKPMFVVPKANYKQFVQDFSDVYPNARLLTPTNADFTAKNRHALLARIATGDWDGVIVTGDQFLRIPVHPRTRMKWVESQVSDMQAALDELAAEQMAQHGKVSKSLTEKEISKAVERKKVELQDLQEELRQLSDKPVPHFEDLGVDQLYVDEADRYKNLAFVTKMGRMKGLSNSDSKRSEDMFLKTKYVQDQGERQSGSFARNGVVFATGTPVANTIAEAWTMMRYLQPRELRRRGLHNFDAWAKTYGHQQSGVEPTATGRYKVVQRFADFSNLPELGRLFQNVADVRVASEVPEMVAARPRLVNDAGEPKRTTIIAPTYPELRAYMHTLGERADNLRNVSPEEDNMLAISNDARKAALDLRMVDRDAPPNPRGKIAIAAEKVAEIYHEEQADKGTQLVFLDMATPKAGKQKGEEKEAGGGDDDSEDAAIPKEQLTGEEQQLLNDAYAALRRHLSSHGVPEDQVAFIQQYKTDKAKAALHEQVNKGEVRVLVGSTDTAGVGINVQERAAALHHLDVPWRPRDVEQREGRVIRQGNVVYGPVKDPETDEWVDPGRGVRIYQYVQQGGFDEVMWKAVEVKAKSIQALMRRNITTRVVEDADSLVLGAREATALASGNPLVLKSLELKNKLGVLEMDRASHMSQGDSATAQVKRLEAAVDDYRDRLPKMDQDAQLAAKTPENAPYAVTIKGQKYSERPKGGKALESALKSIKMQQEAAPVNLGTYRGFDISATYTDWGYQLAVSNPATELAYRSSYMDKGELSAAGLSARLDNLVKGIAKTRDKAKASLQASEASVVGYREQVARPYPHTDELEAVRQELRETEVELSKDPSDEGADEPEAEGDAAPGQVAGRAGESVDDDDYEDEYYDPNDDDDSFVEPARPAFTPAAQEASDWPESLPPDATAGQEARYRLQLKARILKLGGTFERVDDTYALEDTLAALLPEKGVPEPQAPTPPEPEEEEAIVMTPIEPVRASDALEAARARQAMRREISQMGGDYAPGDSLEKLTAIRDRMAQAVPVVHEARERLEEIAASEDYAGIQATPLMQSYTEEQWAVLDEQKALRRRIKESQDEAAWPAEEREAMIQRYGELRKLDQSRLGEDDDSEYMMRIFRESGDRADLARARMTQSIEQMERENQLVATAPQSETIDQTIALRREIRNLGGTLPGDATIEELTTMRDEIKAGDDKHSWLTVTSPPGHFTKEETDRTKAAIIENMGARLGGREVSPPTDEPEPAPAPPHQEEVSEIIEFVTEQYQQARADGADPHKAKAVIARQVKERFDFKHKPAREIVRDVVDHLEEGSAATREDQKAEYHRSLMDAVAQDPDRYETIRGEVGEGWEHTTLGTSGTELAALQLAVEQERQKEDAAEREKQREVKSRKLYLVNMVGRTDKQSSVLTEALYKAGGVPDEDTDGWRLTPEQLANIGVVYPLESTLIPATSRKKVRQMQARRHQELQELADRMRPSEDVDLPSYDPTAKPDPAATMLELQKIQDEIDEIRAGRVEQTEPLADSVAEPEAETQAEPFAGLAPEPGEQSAPDDAAPESLREIAPAWAGNRREGYTLPGTSYRIQWKGGGLAYRPLHEGGRSIDRDWPEFKTLGEAKAFIEQERRGAVAVEDVAPAAGPDLIVDPVVEDAPDSGGFLGLDDSAIGEAGTDPGPEPKSLYAQAQEYYADFDALESRSGALKKEIAEKLRAERKLSWAEAREIASRVVDEGRDVQPPAMQEPEPEPEFEETTPDAAGFLGAITDPDPEPEIAEPTESPRPKRERKSRVGKQMAEATAEVAEVAGDVIDVAGDVVIDVAGGFAPEPAPVEEPQPKPERKPRAKREEPPAPAPAPAPVLTGKAAAKKTSATKPKGAQLTFLPSGIAARERGLRKAGVKKFTPKLTKPKPVAPSAGGSKSSGKKPGKPGGMNPPRLPGKRR